MQSLGFAYAMSPILKKLYPDEEERAARLRVHMEYFNTQPYFASFVLGAAVKLEKERASGRNVLADISGLKATLAPSLGALGDSFFWGALKPLASILAVAMLMVGAWWAPILFLVFYNIIHVGFRAELLLFGYFSGGDVVSFMTRHNVTKNARLIKALALAGIGGFLGMAPLWLTDFSLLGRLSYLLQIVTVVLATWALVALLRKGVSPIKMMLGLTAACIALSYIGVV